MSSWSAWLVYAWPALLLTVVRLFLGRISRDPKTPRGDAVLVDLGLGLMTVCASVLWLQVFALIVF